MTTTRTFLGIPVEGDITDIDRTPQKTIEELQPLLQALLDDDGIACFGWHQYTPYFNDGEPCTFSASSVWVARPEDIDPEDPDEIDTSDLDVMYGQHRLGTYEGGRWVPDPDRPRMNMRVDAVYEGPDQARFDRCKAVYDAIESGEFDDVLLGAFGDHAQITVRRSGIQVDSYEHD